MAGHAVLRAIEEASSGKNVRREEQAGGGVTYTSELPGPSHLPAPVRTLLSHVQGLYTSKSSSEVRNVLSKHYERYSCYKNNVVATYDRRSLLTYIWIFRRILASHVSTQLQDKPVKLRYRAPPPPAPAEPSSSGGESSEEEDKEGGGTAKAASLSNPVESFGKHAAADVTFWSHQTWQLPWWSAARLLVGDALEFEVVTTLSISLTRELIHDHHDAYVDKRALPELLKLAVGAPLPVLGAIFGV